MVHLTFYVEGKSYKVVFKPTKSLFSELFNITRNGDWICENTLIHRVRDNFLINIDEENTRATQKIFDLYINTDPLKWTSIIDILN